MSRRRNQRKRDKLEQQSPTGHKSVRVKHFKNNEKLTVTTYSHGGVYLEFEFEEYSGVWISEQLWSHDINNPTFKLVGRRRWGAKHGKGRQYRRDQQFPIGKDVRLLKLQQPEPLCSVQNLS